MRIPPHLVDRLWWKVSQGKRPSPRKLLMRAGDLAANASEFEHRMRERVREGKAASRGLARMHAALMSQAEDLADTAWHSLAVDRGEER